jgi:serine/threonine protein kinase
VLVYRSLKPENILITEEGHIKLTDYWLSEVTMEQSISSLDYTLECVPFETLDGEFGQEADIWAMGVLMFR